MEKEGHNFLFKEFESVSEENWNLQAQKETGRAELTWKSYEGFPIKPIYSKPDLANSEKGLFQHNQKKDWLLVDNIEVNDEIEANKLALSSLQGGSNGIHFHIDKASLQIDKLLEGIWIDNCLIALSSTHYSLNTVKNFLDYYKSQNLAPDNLRGWFNFDPLKMWLLTGKKYEGLPEDLEKLFQLSSSFPNFQCLTINSHQFVNGGVDIIQEIAFCLATTVEYLEALKSKKFELKTAMGKILYSLTVSTNFFLEISKLRALRVLISKIFKGYDIKISPSEIAIHTQTSYWNKSLLDWENNIIRNSAEAMVGILGGTNYLTITDHNQNRNPDKNFTSRVSRNIYHLLKEEAYLNKVTDPSAGSYYIEKLTAEIAEQSWQLFLELEKEGGFIQCVEMGIIPREIDKIKAKRVKNFDLRKDHHIGVNIYPNLKELTLPHFTEGENSNALVKQQKISQDIEDLREWVETKFTKTGDRPKLLILNLKNEPLNKPTQSFIKNIFNSIGFLVEFNQDLTGWHQMNVPMGKYDLHLAFISADVKENLSPIKEMASVYPVIVTSSEALEIEELNNYKPLDQLALCENLKNLLLNLNNRKK